MYRLVDAAGSQVLLVQGDGRDLSMLEDESVDCIITDHPYEDTASNKGGNRNFATYDTFKYAAQDFVEKARVLKEGAFLVEFFAEENANNFAYIHQCKLWALEAGFQYYAAVPWKKGNFVSNTGRKAKNVEQMLFFTKGPARSLKLDAKKNKQALEALGVDASKLSSYEVAAQLSEYGVPVAYMKGAAGMLPTVFDVPKTPKAETIHQAEKPVALFEQLLGFVSLPGEKVVDQFAGSGNLGVAAARCGRDAILVEKNPEVWERMCEHVRAA